MVTQKAIPFDKGLNLEILAVKRNLETDKPVNPPQNPGSSRLGSSVAPETLKYTS